MRRTSRAHGRRERRMIFGSSTEALHHVLDAILRPLEQDEPRSEADMADIHTETAQERGVGRRTLLVGAAWSVPAIGMMTSTPAFASSTDRTVALSLTSGSTLPAAGSTSLQVTVTSSGGSAFAGAPVTLTGPASATFGSSSGTTDGSGRFSTTVDLGTPWATPGSTVTLSALSDGASASTSPTVLGANLLAIAGGYGTAAVQTERVFPSPVEQALASLNFSIVLLKDGSVWAKGANSRGQLGSGTTSDRSAWAAVPGMSDVVQVTAGRDIVFARRSDGTVWGWGANEVGQMANGGSSDVLSPAAIAGLSDVVHVSAGAVSGHVVLSDGTVRSWGSNAAGQMGIGTTSSSSGLVTANVSNVTQLVTSNRTVIVLLGDGSVRAWGLNDRGQTGTGASTSTVPTPTLIAGLSNISALTGGRESSGALLSDGTVQMWGMNDNGQLGDGTTTDRSTPVAVSGVTSATSVASAGLSTYARLRDGSIVAWGYNGDGRLGDGSTTNRTTPVAVQGLSDHTISRLMNDNGQTNAAFFVIGLESLTVAANPATVSAGADATLTAVVTSASAAVANRTVQFTADSDVQLSRASSATGADGKASVIFTPAAWTRPGATIAFGASTVSASARASVSVLGSNMLGIGGPWGASLAQTERVFPSPVVKAVSSDGFSFAVLADGTVWARGKNASGQLGDGTTTDRSTWAVVPGLTNAIDVSSGYAHAFALISDGTVRAWGANESGQLGDGTTTNRTTPVPVINVSGVTHLQSGPSNGWVRRSDGSVWAWGWNHVGQLGNGTAQSAANPTPAAVTNVTNAVSITTSNWTCIVQLGDGTFVGWGDGSYGQLGDGTTTSRSTPASTLGGLTGVKKVVGGKETFYALLDDGSVKAWGMNDHGQVGDGTTTHALAPVAVSGLSSVADVTGAGRNGFALLTDGTLKGWGWNARGQVGDGTSGNDRTAPVTVRVPVGAGSIRFLRNAGFDGGTFFSATFTASSGTDLARGAAVTVSSTYSTLVAANAIDGDSRTRWSSDFNAANPDTQWLQVDLGGQRRVGKVVLSWETASAKAYTVDVSADGSTWTTVASTSSGAGGIENVTFSTVTARHVRLNLTQRNTSAGYSLWAVEIYEV